MRNIKNIAEFVAPFVIFLLLVLVYSNFGRTVSRHIYVQSDPGIVEAVDTDTNKEVYDTSEVQQIASPEYYNGLVTENYISEGNTETCKNLGADAELVAQLCEETESCNVASSEPEIITFPYIPELYDDDEAYTNFYGRLYIPDVGIDVALYNEYSQDAVDRKDSAYLWMFEPHPGITIGDHNNQEFGKLYDVTPGMKGYIVYPTGAMTVISCYDVFNGHNDTITLTDNDYNDVLGLADYTLYTCLDHWTNVRICLWQFETIEI